MGNADLSLTSIRKAYGAATVLEDINLHVQEGEFVSLLGPSGCGKTTILRIIAGFVEPTDGEVKVGDRVLSSRSAHVTPNNRDMGMVFQSYAIWPHMSVRSNIALPLKVRGVSRSEIDRRVREVVGLCQLERYIDRQPNQLSGGQLQRVAVARSLVYSPKIVLLDEPLSNLDVSLREEMRREIQALHRKLETTFILVTHDQVEAMSMSDKVIVMREGRIEQIGTPQEIYLRPQTEFVGQFVGSANLVRGRVLTNAVGGVAQVDVAGATVEVARMDAFLPGETVKLLIHPEAVRVRTMEGTAQPQNFASATVSAFAFLGRTQEIVLDMAGTPVRAIQMGGRSYGVGEPVLIDFEGQGITPVTCAPPRPV